MELVVDSNIIISALISPSGGTNDLLFSNKIKLFAPEFLLEEIKKYSSEIVKKSGLSEVDLDLALSIIMSTVNLIPFSEFKQFIKKAEEICPDPKDIEFFALALSLNCAIWSEDKRLKKQDAIKVISTTELIKKK